MDYIIQKKPFLVPINDGKQILEQFGLVSTETGEISIAHMIAPPGWSEPFQNPEFDEYTKILKGKKLIEINSEKIILNQGESILVKKNTRVRYSNPF